MARLKIRNQVFHRALIGIVAIFACIGCVGLVLVIASPSKLDIIVHWRMWEQVRPYKYSMKVNINVACSWKIVVEDAKPTQVTPMHHGDCLRPPKQEKLTIEGVFDLVQYWCSISYADEYCVVEYDPKLYYPVRVGVWEIGTLSIQDFMVCEGADSTQSC
jgi:hypothetical protein